jgi:nitrite reductase/ring-hydroxylating ferredoxin subunit
LDYLLEGGSKKESNPMNIMSDNGSSPPACPSAWYLAASSGQLIRNKIVDIVIGPQALVLFRGQKSGQVYAFDAHCSHMGCHLKHGEIMGESLICALHLRTIRGEGICNPIPRLEPGSAAQQQRCFPVLERLGAVFVFLGEDPLFDFPTPVIEAEGPIKAHVTDSFAFDIPWYVLVANGLDVDHLAAVHKRSLIDEPTWQIVAPQIMKLNYRSKVTGKSLSDRLMQWLSGNDIRVNMSILGGVLFMVETELGKRKTCLVLSMRPTTNGTSVRGIICIQKKKGMLSAALSVRLASWLFRSFLKRDVWVLDDLRFHGPGHEDTLGDQIMNCVLSHLSTLPAYRSFSHVISPRVPAKKAG